MSTLNANAVQMEGTRPSEPWPPKYPVLGVEISETNYEDAVERLMTAARERKSVLVTALAVHGLVEAARNVEMGQRISKFDLVVPDGQPVRLALNAIHQTNLSDRVYGPKLTLLLCERAAALGIKVYLYGSTRNTVERLKTSLESRFPDLCVAGAEPSIFRPLTSQESIDLAGRIKESGAGIVFIGLGCPRQENFAFEHRNLIMAVQVCVGAAFDFHAGVKRQAPRWMQDASLEWLFRLSQEPRRLFRRYATTNSIFLWRVLQQYVKSRSRHHLS